MDTFEQTKERSKEKLHLPISASGPDIQDDDRDEERKKKKKKQVSLYASPSEHWHDQLQVKISQAHLLFWVFQK